MLKYKITTNSVLKNELSIEELKHNYRFIYFIYIIPRPFFPPIRRMSSIFLEERTSRTKSLGIKYSLWNALSCWFGLPFGPIHMLQCNRINKKGLELDASLAQRITLDDLHKGIIQVPLYYGTFAPIDKAIQSEFVQIFQEIGITDLESCSPLLAYIKQKGKHYFFLGLRVELSNIEFSLQEHFKKRFDGRSKLQIISLNESGELQQILLERGLLLGHD